MISTSLTAMMSMLFSFIYFSISSFFPLVIKPPPQFQLLNLIPFFLVLLLLPFVMCMYLLVERPKNGKQEVPVTGEEEVDGNLELVDTGQHHGSLVTGEEEVDGSRELVETVQHHGSLMATEKIGRSTTFLTRCRS